MKTSKVINATWSGDEKSVNLSLIGSDKRFTIEVGAKNWEDEDEAECSTIIKEYFAEKNIEITNDFIIE